MRKHTNVDAIWSMDVNGADRHLSNSGTNNGLTDPNVSPPGMTLSFIDFNSLPFLRDQRQQPLAAHPLQLRRGDQSRLGLDGGHLVFTVTADFPNPGDSESIAMIAPTAPDGTRA